jgi:hypothetical protein
MMGQQGEVAFSSGFFLFILYISLTSFRVFALPGYFVADHQRVYIPMQDLSIKLSWSLPFLGFTTLQAIKQAKPLSPLLSSDSSSLSRTTSATGTLGALIG